ncbi:hypothetical protein O6H91_06G037800 [Diphasiastrum complanatum]|nr:hypothetical protein O6H91_06G037800 [Diphasiastrum complanatum]
MTIAGAMDDGLKEVEVWLQTFAPGIGTPIHRHTCEEIFLSFRGIGTLYLASESSEGKVPGNPNKFPIFRNSTFTIPVNAVHQLRNDYFQEDLQVLVIISRPPIKVFVYEDWSTPHSDAKLQYPYYWDATKNERLVCL